jgi:hypothetical protein
MNRFNRKYALYFALFAFSLGTGVVAIREHFSESHRTLNEFVGIVEQFNSAIVEKDEARAETFLSDDIKIRTSSFEWSLDKKDLVSQLARARKC